MEHIIMSTKEQNTFCALKKIKLHYKPRDVPPESDLPLTKDIPWPVRPDSRSYLFLLVHTL